MIIIDGITYDIPVVSCKVNADFLDKYAERTEDGVLHRELIGVYFNYRLQFGRTLDTAEYARLWNKLTEPVEYHTVTVPDEDGNFTYTAYFSNITAELNKDTETAKFWKNLTANFIARSPARS